MRIAVLGGGAWGQNLVRNFAELNVLAAICDRDEARLQTLASRHPGCRTTTSPADIWRDPSIDAVAIATPAETHAALAREALLAGKDVFIEKPLALTLEDGRQVVTLARERGRILMVGHLL